MSGSRRIVILAEGKFGPYTSKTANQAIRQIGEQTGIPAADVLTPQVTNLADAILEYFTSLQRGAA